MGKLSLTCPHGVHSVVGNKRERLDLATLEKGYGKFKNH
jgi:hypothetical protein